jgi:hypothetical protein
MVMVTHHKINFNAKIRIAKPMVAAITPLPDLNLLERTKNMNGTRFGKTERLIT